MKSTSTASRTLRRIAKHLAEYPTVVHYGNLIRLKALNIAKLMAEGTLETALTNAADTIKLPTRFRKNLTRLAEILAIAARCIENTLTLAEKKITTESLVVIKRMRSLGWFKIIQILPDRQVMIQSVSHAKRIETFSPTMLDLVID